MRGNAAGWNMCPPGITHAQPQTSRSNTLNCVYKTIDVSGKTSKRVAQEIYGAVPLSQGGVLGKGNLNKGAHAASGSSSHSTVQQLIPPRKDCLCD